MREATPISPDETTGALHDRLSVMGAGLIVDALARLDDLVPESQPEAGVTYAAKIDKAEARVDWSRDAAQIDRLIRGLSPFPGAWCEVEGVRIKLLASTLAEGVGAPGEVLETGPDGVTVACGQGAVRLLRLQRAGRGAQDAGEFLRGMAMAPGSRL
jgi:methionyl-tRNA formyltransferase